MKNKISILTHVLAFSIISAMTFPNIAKAHPQECANLAASVTFIESSGILCLSNIRVSNNSETQIFKAALQWQAPENPNAFKLISAEFDTATEKSSPLYISETGILEIPVVDIPKLFGTERYTASLTYNSGNEVFELTAAETYLNPAYIANQTWKPYGMLNPGERRAADLLGQSIPYAKLADAVYDFDIQSIDEWQLIEQKDTDSGMQAGVYYNQATDEVVLAFRGTEACEEGELEIFNCSVKEAFLDIAADALLAVGLVDEQFDDAFNYAQDVVKRSQGRKIIVTGHSLGGGLAQATGTTLGLKTFAFNSAPVPEKFFDSYPSELTLEEIIASVHVLADVHDPVSNTDEAGKAYLGSSHVSPLIQFDFNRLEIMPDELADLDALRFNKHGMTPFIEHATEMLTIYGEGW